MSQTIEESVEAIANTSARAQQAADLRHQQSLAEIAKLQRTIKKGKIASLSLIILSILVTSLIQWNLGYHLSFALGFVPTSMSGKEKFAAIQRLEKSNVAAMLKVRQYAESFAIVRGVLYDRPAHFKQAKKINEYRALGHYGEPHEFEFKHWNPHLQSVFIEYATAHGKTNALAWFIQQEKWDANLTDAVKSAALEAHKNPVSRLDDPAVRQENKILRLALSDERRKKRLLLAWRGDDPTYLDGSRPNQQPIELTSMSGHWMKTFLQDAQTQNKTNLLIYIQKHNAAHLFLPKNQYQHPTLPSP